MAARSKRHIDLVSARKASGRVSASWNAHFRLCIAFFSQSFCCEDLVRQLVQLIYFTLLNSSTPLEWNQYEVENAAVVHVCSSFGSFGILWQFNQNQFSKFPAGIWLNYSAISLFEQGHKGAWRRKYFLLFHLLHMAGSVSSQVIHSEGIFVAVKSALITESGRCLCARTWVEHGVNIPYPSTPGWLWLMQTNSFSIEPLRQRWALPCLLSQFIIIILYLNLTQSEQFTQYRSSPDRVGLPFHESDVFCCAEEN